MTNKDLFHNAVEGRMEELKQKPIVEEKETRGEKINKIFFFMLGFVIIISLIF
ncbi:accessory Sec system protein Asp4 [Streptococcus salivarius]